MMTPVDSHAGMKEQCDDGHRPWPATGRHARHTNDAETRHRAQTCREDAHLARDEAESDSDQQLLVYQTQPKLSLLSGNAWTRARARAKS